MSENVLEPNDVAVVLRPFIVDGVWTGGFSVMVSGIGPVTMNTDDMSNMIGMGVLLASVVPLLEKDKDVAEKIMTHCNNEYSDVGVFEYDSSEVPDSISVNTRCVGGMQ